MLIPIPLLDVPQSFSTLTRNDYEKIEDIAQSLEDGFPNCGHEDFVTHRLQAQSLGDEHKFERLQEAFHSRQTPAVTTNGLRPDIQNDAQGSAPQPSVSILTQSRTTTMDDLPGEILGKHTLALWFQPINTVLEHVISHLNGGAISDDGIPRRSDISPCLLVSKKFYLAALPRVYQNVSVRQSQTFFKLLTTLNALPDLARMIRRLDFSRYSNIGYGRTKTASSKIPNITPETIATCLDMTTGLTEFLVHEHLDDELDEGVLSRLFAMPSIQALDFCSCYSKAFVRAFASVCGGLAGRIPPKTWLPLGSLHHIQRLSLHECTTLPETVFGDLLPHLANVTHLDLAHTVVNDEALASLPSTARLTHLNLERCTNLTGEAVVTFIGGHPAARDSLVYLNLMADPSRHRLLRAKDVQNLLPRLPNTLRSLNLGGARVESSHIRLLHPLAAHLEELGLKGANLSLSDDVMRLFRSDIEHGLNQLSQYGHSSLRYLDVTDIRSVTQMSLCYSTETLTDSFTLPLEVIELGDEVLTQIKKRTSIVGRPEWVVRELGRRGWYVRQPPAEVTTPVDDGSRSWKVGSRWWGMRKIPIAEQEVGGMYGFFMFKRA